MISFVLSPSVLGNTRFAFSPMAETVLSLQVIGSPSSSHVHSTWLRRVRAELAEVEVDLLLALMGGGALWIPDFLLPPPSGTRTTIEEQLEQVLTADPGIVRLELERAWYGQHPPDVARRLISEGAAGLTRITTALADYWAIALAPYWPRMCAVLEGDVSYRIAALARDGLFEMLEDLHDQVSVSGDRLLVNKRSYPSALYSAERMTLTPSIFAHPHLMLEDGERGAFALTYPARGLAQVWEGLDIDARGDDEDRLAALLGRTRATILRMTGSPVSTTQVARQLGQSPGPVNSHLSVLRDNGMVTSRRSGRSVLYAQTTLGRSVVEVHEAGPVADADR